MKKRRGIVLVAIVSTLLAGCQQVPEEVKKFGDSTNLLPVQEVAERSKASINQKVGERLSFDADVAMPDAKNITVYQVKPKEFVMDNVFKAFKINKSDFKKVQGTTNGVNDPNYEPTVFTNEKSSLYVDNKVGNINYVSADPMTSDPFDKIEIEIDDMKCNISLDMAMKMIDEITQTLEVEYEISSIKAFRCGDKDSYEIQLYQTMDGVPVDNEEKFSSNAIDQIGRHYIDVVIDDNGIVEFDSRVFEKVGITEVCEQLMDVNTAISNIEETIDLILPSGREYAGENGMVTINKIMLIYLPELMSKEELTYQLKPVWLFQSGSNINSNRYCNIRIDAVTGTMY